MTTFKHPRGKTYRFDFWWTPPGGPQSQRHTGSTGQLTKRAAHRVEAKIKEQVREQAYGIAVTDRMATPSLTAFAAVHVAHLKKKGKHARLDELVKTIRLCLQFWGKRPQARNVDDAVLTKWRKQRAAAAARAAAAPYHDLRLLDPIQRPALIEAFEDWMRGLGLSGGRKNNYRSAMSGIFQTALLPACRATTRISMNPFRHLERDTVPERDATLTLERRGPPRPKSGRCFRWGRTRPDTDSSRRTEFTDWRSSKTRPPTIPRIDEATTSRRRDRLQINEG